MRKSVKVTKSPGATSRRDISRTKLAKATGVSVNVTELTLPTYMPALPEKNPMFLEKRVYQGSSGKVYPLPFTDRIEEKPIDRAWKAVWLENEFLRVLVLPELGGRIHSIQDKSNGYDLIYNQAVIKPALVGLTGPWISGGIEFNWPQHHRPATFLPVDFEVEKHADGSVTVWCSDHDPMCRMKGMHGVCLHPDRAYLELKARVYNRTPYTQSFLWWANVATRVHEAYQSFFPPDVYYVADHARRSMSEYPLAKGYYYGVNFAERAKRGVPADEKPGQFVPPHCVEPAVKNGGSFRNYAPNDLSFYANISTPCSYMCMGSKDDFFGGYDFKADAGIVHFANHHISPGKKQWTWGNHEFGYAWDRNLTDSDATGECSPYIEIMAGVYTDNQPDFSFLRPGETKAWSQYWYPIQKIGPAQSANLDAAISLSRHGREIHLGVATTRKQTGAQVIVERKGVEIFQGKVDISHAKPFLHKIKLAGNFKVEELRVRLLDKTGRELLAYQPQAPAKGEVPPPATEPDAPEKIASNDELYITGVHLEQYRHVTRDPADYWREALRRDPLDCRCNNAMGLWHFKRGEFSAAENYFRKAIERLTRRNANPNDGEAYYNLGQCLRQLGRDDEGYDAFYKATWNQAQAGASYHSLAEIDCGKKSWATALDHLNRALRFDTDNLRARNLKAIVLRELGEDNLADKLLAETKALDPADWWCRHLAGETLRCDLQTKLDLAHDYARAGFYARAIKLLESAAWAPGDLPDQSWGALPMVFYTMGWLQQKAGNAVAANNSFAKAAVQTADYCFPARLEEITILESALPMRPKDARAAYYLGNLFYDRRRHEEAIQLWESSAKNDPKFSIVWRNLGIGYFNIRKQPAQAQRAYAMAVKTNPADARLIYERDQLWKRLGESPARRLRELKKVHALVARRDDLSVELCSLYSQTGKFEASLQVLQSRRFQPWEGGEGATLRQHVRAHLGLGRRALEAGDALLALQYFKNAAIAPENLGEARHLLANQSDIHFWLGCALHAKGDEKAARTHWLAAANFKGDFQEMSVRAFSELTYYSALSWEKLGQRAKAKKLFRDLRDYAKKLQKAVAKIDYFATSLPTMLLFDDDLQARQETEALFMQAQAALGLDERKRARALLRQVLKRDCHHASAQDLLEGI